MELGPRIIAIILMLACWQGSKNAEGFSFNFDAAYQTILVATAVNWCLRLVNEALENWIMSWVNFIEEKIWDFLCKIWSLVKASIVACLRGTVAWMRGTTFPPVIDV